MLPRGHGGDRRRSGRSRRAAECNIAAAAGNASLAAAYPDLVRHWRPIEEPPAEVLARQGAIPSSHPLVVELLQSLIQARQQHWSTPELRKALAPLQPRIAAAEQEHAGRALELSQQPCVLADPAAV